MKGDDEKEVGKLLRRHGLKSDQYGGSQPRAESDAPGLADHAEHGSLLDDLPAAEKIYLEALGWVSQVMSDVSNGAELDCGPLGKVLSDIVSSLERNRDALHFVPRIRQNDVYVYAHCVNVSILLTSFALSDGKSRAEAMVAGLAGILHDIGMAKLPVSLLCSRSRLSPTEQVLVKRHPLLAGDVLSSVPGLQLDVFYAALEHHEHYDGSGYPRGLAGSAISSIGHLTSIADAYDAMTSKRLHREPCQPHIALGSMFRDRQKQFHPLWLERFVRMLGIYPVGSLVELRDGYRGVVTASSTEHLTRPVVTLLQDPKGRKMVPQPFDLAEDKVVDILQCLNPTEAGIDLREVLGVGSAS